MKSLQTKLTVLVVGFIVCSVFISLSVGFKNTAALLDTDSAQIMELQCENQIQQIDEMIRSVEQSVNALYTFAMDMMGNDTIYEEENEFSEYVSKMKTLSFTMVENTQGAVSVYYRFNPELTTPDAGFFIIKDVETGKFIDYTPTDISKYPKEDIGHVGWYYLPIEARKPIWIDPYNNDYIDVEMISYVIPLLEEDGTALGVIGMEIDLNYLRDTASELSIYESGYAVLVDASGNLVYHKNYPKGIKATEFDSELEAIQNHVIRANESGELYSYRWKGAKKRMVSKTLANGMLLAVTVPVNEIEVPQWNLLIQILLFGGIIILLSTFICLHWVKRLVRPLLQLTEAAKQIAKGNMDVVIEEGSQDEVGVLASSFKQTVASLKEYINYINILAYTDVMTQIGNKTAYDKRVEKLIGQIQEKRASFALLVMDVNNLKMVNDQYGHEAGDALLKDAANLMKKVFDEENIFRIGGDEFAVIFENYQDQDLEKLIEKFQSEIDTFNQVGIKAYESELHIAVGLAYYDKEQDCSFVDVFHRADVCMYENKKFQKRNQMCK